MKIKSYANIPEELGKLERAKIVLIPVPFQDEKNGNNESGVEGFLKASEHMELYDIETGTEVYEQGIHIAETITETQHPEGMVNEVHQTAKKFIKKNKFVTLFSNTHTASIGSVRAFNDLFPSITVLYIGGTANSRKDFNGNKYHTKCANHEALQHANLIQVGVRSMSAVEQTIVDADKIYYAHEMAVDEAWMDSAIDQMTNTVFIDFNLNAFDVSIMPKATSPLPGGMFWYETLDFLKQVFSEKNVVGFNIVGLNARINENASNLVASKLYYKMLSYKFMNEVATDDYDNTYDNTKQKNNISKFNDNDEY